MNGLKYFFAVGICLWLAAGCQRTVTPYVALAHVRPDLILVSVGCLTLFTERRTGSVVGFAGGVLQGALAGANLAAYAITRTIGGFLVGWFSSMDFESSPVVAAVVVAVLTVVAQVLLMFIAPTGEIGAFLLATIGSAVYNGVLAMPLYAILRRVLDPPLAR